jgi:hypothetical protein
MARFNLEDYETVEERIRRFYDLHPDGRIITENETTVNDRAQAIWIVKAYVYLSTGDQANSLPKSTGYAFEVDGVGMANQTSALENCETSAIGRALANMNLSGNKRTSREEMEKVARGVTPTKASVPVPDFFDNLIEDAPSLVDLEKLWATAAEGGYSEQVKDLFTKRKKELNK